MPVVSALWSAMLVRIGIEGADGTFVAKCLD